MSTRIALLLGALALACAARAEAGARSEGTLERSVRDLDGEELIEDVPLWMCSPEAISLADPEAWSLHSLSLVRRGKGPGARMHWVKDPRRPPDWQRPLTHNRAFELTQTFGFVDPSNRAPLLGQYNGIPAGLWELDGGGRDSGVVYARFRVVAPQGSELSVRAGLARASRLVQLDRPAEAAALYDAIYRRYPRTAYASVIYWGEWGVREHTRFNKDPDRWLEEIFALFHDSCFGVVALDRFVADMGQEAALPTVRRLVGIYPDTPLSRAAQAYF